jgi:hypothetical protein
MHKATPEPDHRYVAQEFEGRSEHTQPDQFEREVTGGRGARKASRRGVRGSCRTSFASCRWWMHRTSLTVHELQRLDPERPESTSWAGLRGCVGAGPHSPSGPRSRKIIPQERNVGQMSSLGRKFP